MDRTVDLVEQIPELVESVRRMLDSTDPAGPSHGTPIAAGPFLAPTMNSASLLIPMTGSAASIA